jgi:hypothetical protein
MDQGAKRRRLNQDKGEQSLWLVRLPLELAEIWSSAQHSDVLGTASIKIINTGTKQLEVTVSDGRVYTIEEQNAGGSTVGADAPHSFFAFSEQEKGAEKSFSLEGKVTKRCLLRAKDPSQRRSSVASMSALPTNVKNRQLSQDLIREKQSQQQTHSTAHQLAPIASEESELIDIGKAQPMKSLSEQETTIVDNEILLAFKVAVSVSARELFLRVQKRIPNISESLVKDRLKRVADYNESGRNHGQWQLKRQYSVLSSNAVEAKT